MSNPPSASGASRSPAGGTNAHIPGPRPFRPSSASSSSTTTTSSAPKQNPALKAMGLPAMRLRLPSRNWLIFLSLTGSFTCAVLYDRRQKKRVQAKWSGLVAPLAEETLAPNQLPRRVRIYVQAPPGDGLTPARELFYEYVKPILVAGGMEWEVVEGRREGDVRWGVAEGIRKGRRRGEGGEDGDEVIRMARERAGTREWDGVGGELVLGRHAWKEFVRGLHEGWLGPVEKVEVEEAGREEKALEKGQGDGHGRDGVVDAAVETLKDVVEGAGEKEEVQQEEAKEKTEEEKAEEERKKRYKPDPYNSISDYANAPLARSIPEELGPTTIIPFPHLIGFMGTPRRVWRFLQKRKLADEIGREVAALVLATQYRPFESQTEAVSDVAEGSSSNDTLGGEVGRERRVWEQEKLLEHEEEEWHKVVRKRVKEEGVEDVWKDAVVMDERIAGRMRRFVLSREDEERADRIASGELKPAKEEE
ncbi:Mitochondrial import inner membrane translocase subunit tim54 [Sphaceloma murrayae]|uniref:Mitochondrial import inner membrane translocase subunit TIM54 n=1 Tax=Sphaceloma murrayae TaxID=2082308 RepID=A0A2K1QXQ3_9PEZI|nr:Mitochondrial import inner membrane translocase subunit tim54 [Sphaceloma murrayae]